MELVVKPYKDAKDTWLLGPVDEVDQLVEDSLIALGAVAASRHVGGIRSAVGEQGRVTLYRLLLGPPPYFSSLARVTQGEPAPSFSVSVCHLSCDPSPQGGR